MTTDENILLEMIDRATNPSRDSSDTLAVQMFCMIVQGNNALVSKAHELIVKKMHSTNNTEATRAIGLLEECMSKGGLEFQKKTAKFSFLNELIALVLDKHTGTPAPITIKKRIMECLMLWTVEHQDKTKIQDAYNNLKQLVNFDHESLSGISHSPDLVNSRDTRSSILGKDDQVVAKLIKQGGAENYKKANLLIQQRVNQETSRAAFICHLKSELKKIESTMEVLKDMLNSYSSDAQEADNCEIIQYLFNNCKGYNEQMARWPDFLGDSEPEFLKDVVNTKELLINVIQRYKDIFENEDQYSVSATKLTTPTNTELLSELLGDTLTTSIEKSNPIKPSNTIETNETMDDLNEIFGSIIDSTENNKAPHPSDLLTNLDLLEPISVFETENAKGVSNKREEKKAQGFKELSEIDKLSEEMFKQSLKEEQRVISFKNDNKKLALNDLANNKIQASLIASRPAEGCEKTHIKSSITSPLELPNAEFNENKVNSHKKLEVQENEEKLTNELQNKSNGVCHSSITSKPLAEIQIDLEKVNPLDEGQRLLLDDEDIQVTLNFTSDRPSEHVSVIVMTVTNKSKLPVKDFQFEASAKKPCKVRLLAPTDVSMVPRKPFRPSTPINQVILLLNPTQKPVDLICIIGYKLGDDPDPIKESIVTRDIPYV